MHHQHTIDDQCDREDPLTQGILVPLDLGDLKIISQSLQPDGSIEVYVVARTDRAACPTCTKICVKVHDRHERRKIEKRRKKCE